MTSCSWRRTPAATTPVRRPRQRAPTHALARPFRPPQFPDTLTMLKGIVKLTGPSLETSSLGFSASLPGTFAGIQVSAVMDIRNKLNAINGERVFVKLSATDVNLKNAIIELFKVAGSAAPTAVTDALANINFPQFKSDQLPGGRTTSKQPESLSGHGRCRLALQAPA